MSKNFLTNWRTLASVMAVIAICVVACGSNTSDNNQTENTVSEVVAEDDVQAKETNSVIYGKIDNSPNELVILRELTVKNLIFLDSVRTDQKGNYELKAALDQETLVLVNIGNMQSPGVPMVMKPDGKIKLTIDNSSTIPLTTVKGDDANEKMKKLYDLYIVHGKKSQEFNERVSDFDPRTASDSLKKALNAEYISLQKAMSDDIMNFVVKTEGSVATFFAATYILPEPTMELQDAALEAMKKGVPDSRYTKELEERLNAIKPLDIGGMAPEIKLMSPDGNEIALSSLRGQYVLIDFWASWCGPCRRENPNVVKVYNKYHSKGFEIFGVSLDKDGNKWKGAIKQDGLTWMHVSDLKGWQSVAAATYNIHSIPATILLDKSGRIIAKDLRGQALEAKLQEIFN